MKSPSLALLVLILVIGVANLLSSFGILGGSGGGGKWEYQVLNSQQMDAMGFKAVAKDVGIEPDEEGKMKLPADKLIKTSLLPRTLEDVSTEGWEFVSVTSDHHYIFRKK